MRLLTTGSWVPCGLLPSPQPAPCHLLLRRHDLHQGEDGQDHGRHDPQHQGQAGGGEDEALGDEEEEEGQQEAQADHDEPSLGGGHQHPRHFLGAFDRVIPLNVFESRGRQIHFWDLNLQIFWYFQHYFNSSIKIYLSPNIPAKFEVVDSSDDVYDEDREVNEETLDLNLDWEEEVENQGVGSGEKESLNNCLSGKEVSGVSHYTSEDLDCDVSGVKFMYPERVLGVVISQSGDLVVDSGEGDETPTEDVLEPFQQSGVKLQADEGHEGEVGETEEDVDKEEKDQETFDDNIEGFVRGEDW